LPGCCSGKVTFWSTRNNRSAYNPSRTHLALEKDAPLPRSVAPPTTGRVVAFSQSVVSIIATNVGPRSAPHLV
jgi:hypothetical protein